MKGIIALAIVGSSFIFGCKSQTETQKEDSTQDSGQTKISKRDYSISIKDSYSDLSLDSMSVENFVASRNLPEKVARRIISFYNARNYYYAWFASDGLTEQALGFWNLHNYTVYTGDTSFTDHELHNKMQALTTEEEKPTLSGKDKSIQRAELLMTEHFVEYILKAYPNHEVTRKEAERFIPLRKEDPIDLGDSLLHKKHKTNKYYDEVNDAYKLLKVQLGKYIDIYRNGGWHSLPTDVKLYKKKESSPAIAMLKKRLRITGELEGNDSSAIYDDTLANAIKVAEHEYGFTEDGNVSLGLLKDLNVPVKERVKQLLANINRMRWMPQEPAGKLILVNIPEFVLHSLDGKKKVFDMNVIVGKEGHNTVMFTGKLSSIVFSPYWNVPPSIVKKEILPKMASNPDYLNSQDMEITGNEGGLPVIRQKPGDKNSLGRVKFLFPNSFNIYLHDTDARSLFGKDKRAFSHGCVRIAEPEKMADYLLQDEPQWPQDKIREAMYSGKEQTVQIKSPVPVFITYYTSWVDENGHINFRDDIYGRDSSMVKKMFY